MSKWNTDGELNGNLILEHKLLLIKRMGQWIILIDIKDVFKVQNLYLLETVNRVKIIEFFLDIIKINIRKNVKK